MKVEVVWEMRGRYQKNVLELAPYDANVIASDGEVLDHLDSEEIKQAGFVLFMEDDGMVAIHANQIAKMEIVDGNR